MNRMSLGVIAVLIVSASGMRPAGGPGPQDEKYKKAFKGIHLPAQDKLDEVAAKSSTVKKYVDWLKDENSWASVFEQLETRLGLFYEDLNVRVEVLSSNNGIKYGQGSGMKGKGHLTLWLGSIRSLDKLKDAIVHEMAHVYTGGAQFGPLWLDEGMANYAAESANGLVYFRQSSYKVQPVDQPITQLATYGRGFLFVEYIVRQYGEDAFKQFMKDRMDKTKYEEAFEKATKKKWSDLVREEFEWSEKNWAQVEKDYKQRKQKK